MLFFGCALRFLHWFGLIDWVTRHTDMPEAMDFICQKIEDVAVSSSSKGYCYSFGSSTSLSLTPFCKCLLYNLSDHTSSGVGYTISCLSFIVVHSSFC